MNLPTPSATRFKMTEKAFHPNHPLFQPPVRQLDSRSSARTAIAPAWRPLVLSTPSKSTHRPTQFDSLNLRILSPLRERVRIHTLLTLKHTLSRTPPYKLLTPGSIHQNSTSLVATAPQYFSCFTLSARDPSFKFQIRKPHSPIRNRRSSFGAHSEDPEVILQPSTLNFFQKAPQSATL